MGSRQIAHRKPPVFRHSTWAWFHFLDSCVNNIGLSTLKLSRAPVPTVGFFRRGPWLPFRLGGPSRRTRWWKSPARGPEQVVSQFPAGHLKTIQKRCGCGSKLNRRGKPLYASTYRSGNPFWNSGCFEPQPDVVLESYAMLSFRTTKAFWGASRFSFARMGSRSLGFPANHHRFESSSPTKQREERAVVEKTDPG